MIRNIFLALSSLIILTTACSSTTGEQTEKKDTEKTVTGKTGAIEYLTYDTFITKVWNFEENPQNFIYNGDVPAIVDFYADWCGPCKRIAPIMEKLAKEYDGKLKVYKIDVDKEQKLAGVFQVRSIPSILFIPKTGQPMMQAGALTEETYRQIIDEQLMNKK